MKKIKIAYFADGIWAHNAFKLIQNDDRFEIRVIIPRFDTQDEVLLNFAKNYNIDYIKSKNINSQEFVQTIKKYDCDIFVSMSFNQIFKKEIINVPKLKTINCHAGKLPFYRGRNILNWVLINDEKEFGITVHFVDEGIDTGDIIIQETFPIKQKDNYKTLLEKASVECANLLYKALIMFYEDSISPIPQKGVGFYCSKRKEGDEIIDFNQTSKDIFNFIRALSNYPVFGAKSYINGKNEITIYEAKIIKNAPKYKDKIGAVVGIENKHFIVKTQDTTIKITKYLVNKKIKIGDILMQKPILA